jgi:hypothetical protein
VQNRKPPSPGDFIMEPELTMREGMGETIPETRTAKGLEAPVRGRLYPRTTVDVYRRFLSGGYCVQADMPSFRASSTTSC